MKRFHDGSSLNVGHLLGRLSALCILLFFNFLFFDFQFSLSAQQIGSWQVYPAYTVCTRNIPAGNKVYALMESKLMAYDTEDESITTFDWQRQLNDISISFIHYCAEAKRLVIIYDNGNIDLLSTQDDTDVINLSQLKNNTLQNKTVNNLQVRGTKAYVCTGFGVLVIDVKEGIINNTYNLGLAVNSCAATDDALYLGTANGILKGAFSENLQDKKNWQQVDAQLQPTRMEYFDGRIWAQQGNQLFLSDAAVTQFTSALQFTPSFMNVSDNSLLLGNASNLIIYSSATNSKQYPGTYSWSELRKQGNTFWASDNTEGLQGYVLDDAGSFQLKTSQLHPNSPLHDYSYHLRFVNNRLLVSGGNRNYSSSSRPGTAMILDADGKWINFDAKSVVELLPKERFLDVTDIAQDPQDADHHYVGTARSGIFEFQNARCKGHYGYDNSPLQSILPTNPSPQNFVVGNGVQYDSEGNLWVLNSRVDTIIHILKPDGKWKSLYFEDIAGISAIDNFLFDSYGYVWMNSRRVEGRGIIQLDYNGTIDNTRDDKIKLRSSITNQDGTVYTPDEFYCMTEDLDGRIWIGTNLGTFIINEPGNFRQENFTYEQLKVSRQDGSGLADYLLNGIPVLCITVDGGGRLWFGSQNSGVYLISRDGQEEIHHFTTDNSPLISNSVYDIAIDHQTGRVYFATEQGLCSYVSDATQPVQELQADNVIAYPNPVAPDYNGPIVIKGLVQDSEVKILTSSGALVWRGKSNGGMCSWDGCNKSGRRVSSGVYHVVANDPDGNSAVVTRIAIIH